MSLNVAALEILVAKGLSASDILEVARALEIRKDPTAAERQRRRRERLATETAADGGEVDCHAVTVTRDVTRDETPAPNKNPPDPQKLTPTPPTRETRAREATRLPEDWEPAALRPETVAGETIGRRGSEWGRRTLESFRCHWRSANGPNARKRDWQAAWAKWVIEQDNRDGRYGRNNGMAGNDRPRSGYGTTVDAALDFIADVRGGSGH